MDGHSHTAVLVLMTKYSLLLSAVKTTLHIAFLFVDNIA